MGGLSYGDNVYLCHGFSFSRAIIVVEHHTITKTQAPTNLDIRCALVTTAASLSNWSVVGLRNYKVQGFRCP